MKIKAISLFRTNLIITDPDQEGEMMNEIITSQTHYDEQGNETERLTFSPSGEPEERILIRYQHGKAVEEILELEGETAERTTREFDSNGLLIAEYRHYQDGEPDKITYTYESGRLVSRITTDSDGEEGEKHLWNYEGDKLVKEESINEYGDTDLIRTHQYHPNGQLAETEEVRISDDNKTRTVFIFSESGILIQEKRYDSRGNLVARSTVTPGENNLPAFTEEETVMGKTTTEFTYDEKGNNILLLEKDTDGKILTTISRSYDEAGNAISTEVLTEPALNRPGQHYRLRYDYEYYS